MQSVTTVVIITAAALKANAEHNLKVFLFQIGLLVQAGDATGYRCSRSHPETKPKLSIRGLDDVA